MYYRILDSWGRRKNTATYAACLLLWQCWTCRDGDSGDCCAHRAESVGKQCIDCISCTSDKWCPFSVETCSWGHFGKLSHWKFVLKLLLPLILSSNVISGMLVNGYQPAQGRECWCVVFASFHCVNTHTLANVKSLMKRHWTQDWEELCTVGSLVLIWVVSATTELHTQ